MTAAGAGWLGLTADQPDMGAVRSVAEQIEREWGGVAIIFADAGIQAFKPILEMDNWDWHDQVDVNVNGTANVVRVFAPLLMILLILHQLRGNLPRSHVTQARTFDVRMES